MKKLFDQLKDHAKNYIDGQVKSDAINLKANHIISTIKEAQSKSLALHVIYDGKSFTGDLVKYDKNDGKIILKNFQQNISTIIFLNHIERVSLVPPTVKNSQLQHKKVL